MRLDKYLQQAGVSSRRKAKELIKAGLVTVDGRTERDTSRDVDTETVRVNGEPIQKKEKLYILMNKPKGYVCTKEKRKGQKTVYDLLPDSRGIFSVGRLDKDTTGLLILTNDGELSYRLTHPSFENEKTYHVTVKGKINKKEIKQLCDGVSYLDDNLERVFTAPAKIRLIYKGVHSILEVTIYEGKKRQIRRMFEAVGHPVLKLKRVREGPLDIGSLKEGSWRYLSQDEVDVLRRT